MNVPLLKNSTSRLHFLIASALVIFLIALTLIIVTGGSAGANDDNEPCVPKDAYTEVIEHPAVTEVIHHEAVYATEYHFRKFTRIKTQSPAVDGFWQNFQPNHNQGPFVGPPSHPTDARGTWSAPKKNGGPQPDASGVFQNGNGNGSWFYRSQGTAAGAWSEFSGWTPWEPPTHQSWEDSDTPLGVPQFHGQGTYSDGTKWYREWQTQADGQTRQGDLITEAYDETVVIKEAWTETIEHPAVVCETTPPTPTETPTVTDPPVVTETPTVPTETPTVVTETPTVPTETPTVPTETETPEVPTETKTPEVPIETPKDDSSQFVKCVNGVFTTFQNGEIIAESGTCDETTTTVVRKSDIKEEGL